MKYKHTGLILSIRLLFLFLLSSCARDRFQHCLFNDLPVVKGRVTSVADETTFFYAADSSAGKAEEKLETLVASNYENFGGISSIQNSHHDLDDLKFCFDILGKFSRDIYFFHKDSLRNRIVSTYTPYADYNLEDNYLYKNDNRYLLCQYRYNEACSILEFKDMDNDTKVKNRYVFVYDDMRNITESIIYNGLDSLAGIVKYEYDKYNNETGYAIYNAKKQLTVKYSFSYNEFDSTGNWHVRNKYKNGNLLALTRRKIKF